MNPPVDVGVNVDEIKPALNFGAEDMIDDLIHVDPGYAQIAERRSQLEDAETLRRVRAL